MEPDIETEVHLMPFKGSGPAGFFNTFRLGKKWAEKVKAGQVINLYENANGEEDAYSEALVLHVDIGPMEDMLVKHASLNAAALGMQENADQRIAVQNAVDVAYGKSITSGEVVTVVYLVTRPEDL